MTNWIEQYSDKGVRKFQDGGAMPAQAQAAPAGGAQGGAPESGQEGGQQLDQMLAQYAQSRDPQLAVAICDALVEMMAQQQGGAQMAKCGAKMKKGGKKGPVFKKMALDKADEAMELGKGKDKNKKK